MNKSITSKGPWEVSRTFNRATEQNAVVVLGNGGLVVAYFGFLSRKEDTDTDRLRLSNAKLASKAPEMLEAMIEFCDRVDRGEVRSKKTYAKFKAIIKEATEI